MIDIVMEKKFKIVIEIIGSELKLEWSMVVKDWNL